MATPTRLERIARGIEVRSRGIYALSSWREMAYVAGPRILPLLALLVAPLVVADVYWQRVLSIAAVYGLLALSFDFLAHYVGLVSLGGALFVGVGGYAAGALSYALGWPPVLTIPTATLGGAALCTLMLWPGLRLRGIYFTLLTLVLPLLIERSVAAFDVLGGTEGLSGLHGLPGGMVEVYLPLAALLIALWALRRLVASDLGLVLRAIKDNDQSVRACGIDVTAKRATAVFVASGMGCFAGAYLAHLYSWAGISMFALDFSIVPIAATVVGGPATLFGPVLGSFILVPLSEVLRDFGTLRTAFHAVLIVLFVVFWSEGLLNWLSRKYRQFERSVEV